MAQQPHAVIQRWTESPILGFDNYPDSNTQFLISDLALAMNKKISNPVPTAKNWF